MIINTDQILCNDQFVAVHRAICATFVAINCDVSRGEFGMRVDTLLDTFLNQIVAMRHEAEKLNAKAGAGGSFSTPAKKG